MIRKYLILMGIILNIFTVAGCRQLLNARVGTRTDVGERDSLCESAVYEITDTDRETKGEAATEISLDQLAGEILTIEHGGTYTFRGKSKNCRIVVNAYDDEIVHLILEGIELYAKDGPAVYIQKAGKVIITTKEGTENVISDSAEYSTPWEACIFSSCDLTLNGKGKLNVYGYYHDGIRSKDHLKVIETELYVKAKNNGIRGNDGVVIENSNIQVESEGTGILTNSEDGYVVISNGICKVTSGENAIYADSYVSVQKCDSVLYSVEEAVKCNGVREIEGADGK